MVGHNISTKHEFRSLSTYINHNKSICKKICNLGEKNIINKHAMHNVDSNLVNIRHLKRRLKTHLFATSFP